MAVKKLGRPKIKEPKIAYPIRLRPSLLNCIRKIAEKNNRSLNGEIEFSLTEKYIKT